MAKKPDDLITRAKRKFLAFEEAGLKKYRKYLKDQLEMAGDKKSKRLYKKYIEDQLVLNDKRLKSVRAKADKLAKA